MRTDGAPYRIDATFRGEAVLAASVDRLRALLSRVQACNKRDAELSHDVWWELVDVPTGGARMTGSLREINYTAGDPALKPFWRPLSVNHFGDQPDGPFLIESLDRAVDLCRRVLTGWRWQLYDGGGPDNDKCYACVHSRFGAFSALQNSLPAAFVAAILEAKIALAETDDEARSFWGRPLPGPPQGRQFDAFQIAAPPAVLGVSGGNRLPRPSA